MRERLKSPPAEEIVKYLIGPRIHGDLNPDFAALSQINMAHAVMLLEQGIITRETARPLLRTLREMDAGGAGAIKLDPAKEDLYFNVEGALIDKVGIDIGGQLHTGRSRNDIAAAISRIKARTEIIRIARAALDLEERLLDLAEQNAGIIMTGYTHMQPGQPITVGHYVTGVAQAFRRDIARLFAAYTAANLSALGAGAFATTGFPISRERTAELLGFPALVENSLDAVASRDYVSDMLYAFSMMAITVSRFALDLHVWFTFEYAYIDIDDSIAGTSSIMPQKKNPSPIEHLKAKPAHLMGALMANLTALKATPFTHGREAGIESVSPLKEALNQMDAVLGLCNAVARGLHFRADNLLAHARRNYCTLTELADMLVAKHGLSFRLAHEVVGTLAREANEQGLAGAHEISVELVNKIATQVTGRNLAASAADVEGALDPRRNADARSVRGGPAAEPVNRMIKTGRQELGDARAKIEAHAEALTQARKKLQQAVDGLAGPPA